MKTLQGRGMAWLLGLVLFSAVSYALSLGPACWLCKQGAVRQESAWKVYRPIIRICYSCGTPIRTAMYWYADLWGDEWHMYNDLGPTLSRNSTSPIEYEFCYSWRVKQGGDTGNLH